MSISPFPNPSRFPPIEDLPLLEEVAPLAHHKHGIVASKYATAYDCSSLLTVVEEGDENNSLLREIKEFYDEYGYVVLQDVFNSHQCERTRDAMWEILEQANPGMKRDDQESWNALKSKGELYILLCLSMYIIPCLLVVLSRTLRSVHSRSILPSYIGGE